MTASRQFCSALNLWAAGSSRRPSYQLVDEFASEYQFVPPDCITFRGLKVSHRPKYAMCGYRLPAGTYDTLVADATLLSKARGQNPFRADWESIVQQPGFR